MALPNALLQSGFGGLAASLRSVGDINTALPVVHFDCCWREDTLPPAEALRVAQQWLRDTTNRGKPSTSNATARSIDVTIGPRRGKRNEGISLQRCRRNRQPHPTDPPVPGATLRSADLARLSQGLHHFRHCRPPADNAPKLWS